MLLSLFAEILTRSALINCGSSTKAFWCHAVTAGRLVSPKRASTPLKNIFAVRPSHRRVRAILPHFTSIKWNRCRYECLGGASCCSMPSEQHCGLENRFLSSIFPRTRSLPPHFANNVVFTAAAMNLIIVLISFVVWRLRHNGG